MNLALAIVFLWIGCALLTVAFHPLGDNAAGSPLGVFQTLQGKIGQQSSAYAGESPPAAAGPPPSTAAAPGTVTA
jgi:hypothetical protein